MTASDNAYYQLNDLYLSIQRGEVKMSLHNRLILEDLLNHAYSVNDSMRNWWMNEFYKLPDYFNF